jgi:hypothetical protein
MALNPRTAVDLTRPVFKGPHATLLEHFYELLLALWEQHYTSPVFAGDEMIFALGGNGYEIVLSHLGFKTLVEIRSPHARIDLRPESDGSGVTIANFESPEGLNIEEVFRDFSIGIVDYYEGNGPRLRL